MKLQIASDIHREFGHSPEVPDIGADVLVLAGDIGYANDETIEWLRDDLAGRYEAILYVPGNHEYYGRDLHEANRHMEEMAMYGEYEWVNNRAVQVGDRRFVGTPLWANFCNEPLSMFNAGRAINDFHRIRHGGGPVDSCSHAGPARRGRGVSDRDGQTRRYRYHALATDPEGSPHGLSDG